MQSYQRLIVALDLSRTDASLLNYAREISERLSIKCVTAIHVIQSREYAATIPTGRPSVLEWKKAEREKEITRQEAKCYFSSLPKVQLKVVVKEGVPLETLHHRLQLRKEDLLLIGRKENSTHSGIEAENFLMEGNTDLVLISQSGRPRLEKLVLAIDDFRYAKDVVDVAKTLLRDKAIINPMNAFYLANKGKENPSVSKFVQDHPGLIINKLPDEHSWSDQLAMLQKKQKVDMIIATPGPMCRAILKTTPDIPLWIVK